MSDFEERLRATVNQRSDDFEPSPDLPDRIDARVRHHRRRRQFVTGGLVSVAATLLAVMAMVSVQRRDEEAPIRMHGPDDETTTTSSPPSTTSTTSTTTSTTSSTTEGSTGSIDTLTPLSRQGLGGITAGMTLREAQAAGGLTITPPPVGGECGEAQLAGLDPSIWIVAEPSTEPGADPMDAIVRGVGGSVLPTEDGAIVGQSRAELVAALGQPTRTDQVSVFGGPAELLVFEADGFAYGAWILDDMVYGVQSGDPAWMLDLQGCPE